MSETALLLQRQYRFNGTVSSVALAAFAARLQGAMDRAGYNQVGLAKAVGAKRSAVQQWTAGKNYPGGEYLVQLPKLLSVSGHWLLTGEEPERAVDEPEALKVARRNGWAACAAQVTRALASDAEGLPGMGEDDDDQEQDRRVG